MRRSAHWSVQRVAVPGALLLLAGLTFFANRQGRHGLLRYSAPEREQVVADEKLLKRPVVAYRAYGRPAADVDRLIAEFGEARGRRQEVGPKWVVIMSYR